MMRSSEPFHHFVDDYLAYLHEVHPTGATLDGVHTYDDHIEDFSRQAIEQHTRALSGFSRRLQDINHERSDGGRKGRAADGGREHPGADVRARADPHVGAQPAALLRHAVLEPRGAGGVHARAAARARAPRAVEAAPDRPARAGGPRQHQGSAGHLRQGRPRDVPRRAQLHREGSAARVLGARRHAPARRSGRCVDRGDAGDFELHPVPRGRRGAQGARVVPARARACSSGSWRSTKGITMDADRLLSIALREFQATQDEFRSLAGKLERRRSDCGVAQGEGRASGAGRACRRRRSSSSRSSAPSSIATASSRGPKGSR